MTDRLPDLPENWQNLKPPAEAGAVFPKPLSAYGPEPEPPKRRGRKAAPKPAPEGDQSLPRYLASLVALGVDREIFTECEVELRLCWIECESADGHKKAAPLAHLAPDALETLEAWGFDGHTTFALTDGRGGEPLAYFAAVLPEAEPEAEGEAATPDARMDRIERLLMHQIQQQAAPAGDPMGSLKQAITLLREVAPLFQQTALPQPEPRGGIGEILDTVATVSRLINQGRPEEPPPAPEIEQ